MIAMLKKLLSLGLQLPCRGDVSKNTPRVEVKVGRQFSMFYKTRSKFAFLRKTRTSFKWIRHGSRNEKWLIANFLLTVKNVLKERKKIKSLSSSSSSVVVVREHFYFFSSFKSFLKSPRKLGDLTTFSFS
ncbi:hypothetical protein [Lactococcus cremoris]|uniref:hypothetical protein n=1 Tax=Lactococcus lactis subsp. cremoris TaxID=1359 RepID=UPI00163B00CD|nr:hypothetical protein [Lactococcus cremoris]